MHEFAARCGYLKPRVQRLDQLRAAVHAELAIKIAAVIDRRVFADPQTLGDLGPGPPERQQLADLELAAGERQLLGTAPQF
jgi:hypothetical protein